MKNLIIIPARKGSKRLKNKNFLKLNGKTLLEHTIEFAKSVNSTDLIIVSTDSKKLKDLSKNYIQYFNKIFLKLSKNTAFDLESINDDEKIFKLKNQRVAFFNQLKSINLSRKNNISYETLIKNY